MIPVKRLMETIQDLRDMEDLFLQVKTALTDAWQDSGMQGLNPYALRETMKEVGQGNVDPNDEANVIGTYQRFVDEDKASRKKHRIVDFLQHKNRFSQ